MATKEDLERQVAELKEQLEKQTASNKLVYYKPEKLRNYDGSSEVTEWIEDCKSAFSEGYSEKEKVSFVLNHLSGQAKREVRLHGTKAKPDQIFTILLENFGGLQLLSAAQRNFFERVQQPGESVREFSLSLSDLMNVTKKIKSTGSEDEVLRDHFISGLNDSVLRKELRRATTKEKDMKFMECRKIAIQWSEDKDLNPQNTFEPQVLKIEASSEIDSLKKLISKQQSQINELMKFTGKNTSMNLPQNRVQTPKCYICSDPGHFKNACPFAQSYAHSQPPAQFRFPRSQNVWTPQRNFMSPPNTGLSNPRFFIPRSQNFRFSNSQMRGRTQNNFQPRTSHINNFQPRFNSPQAGNANL